VAAKTAPLSWGALLLTALFSLLIQIGTNYANDYFDFIKGADTPERKGPKRAVQQGWIAPRSMLIAASCAFALASLAALPLMLQAGLWSFGLAALCVLFGFLYTGGPKPLGYAGLGELLVFVFFGPVTCIGTYFLQTGSVSLVVFLASLAPGFLSAAILMANNLRDEATDRIAAKRTLVVRFGSSFGKSAYVAFILCAAFVPVAFVAAGFPLKLLGASLILGFAPYKKVFGSIEALQETSLLLILYTLLFSTLI